MTQLQYSSLWHSAGPLKLLFYVLTWPFCTTLTISQRIKMDQFETSKKKKNPKEPYNYHEVNLQAN